MAIGVQIRVLFFGILKDVIGRSEDSLEVPEGGKLEDVLAEYGRRFPRLRDMSASIVLARNQQFSAPSTPVAEGDEVALLPPVSGGSAQEIRDEEGHFFALTRETIDAKGLATRLLRGEDGAVVDFEGVVRNNSNGRRTLYLDYECYEPMALKVMADLGREIVRSYPIGRIAIVHRLGRMQVGETSVAIVVTAPHRKPAFEAALEGINRLKRLVPIWKKEYFEDGEVWVEGSWDDSVLKSN
jgi:molybdopterin synthase catalytic subunit/molybdopterin converting factor small subunit